MKCPCTRECAMRSADCRRTCGAFRAYDEQRMQEYKLLRLEQRIQEDEK